MLPPVWLSIGFVLAPMHFTWQGIVGARTE
jgi:hypothetical protein